MIPMSRAEANQTAEVIEEDKESEDHIKIGSTTFLFKNETLNNNQMTGP